ncbi:JAB domain-containing protein [Clostridium sp.]|uniref:JAB domain-containing protein n=1 Tax=Clostridium sp. TaxID=1506 RepID=UPI003F334142
MKNEILRETITKYSAETLSELELVSLILGEKVANKIKENEIYSLANLVQHSDKEIKQLLGITDVTLSKVKALFELSARRIGITSGDNIRSPKDIVEVAADMEYLEQEVLRLYCLNTKNIIVKKLNLFKGGINTSIVDPRTLFKEALKCNSASIVICHNHPSGDPTPSKEDISLTTRLKECGRILGVTLVDHIIIGSNGKYTSLKEKGVI